MFRFKCSACDDWHEGMPSYGAHEPAPYLNVPEDEHAARCSLDTDTCTIDDQWFFVRGSLEIPVHGAEEPFSWGVWVSLSRDSFAQFQRCFEDPVRAHIGPFFGWLSTALPLYPDTQNLKTMVHLRDGFIIPYIELEPTEHPLAVEQRTGISVERLAEIYAHFHH